MKRIILHIGQSKTGTTSLQTFLANNRTNLAKSGILYPDIYNNGIPLNMLNYNALAEELAGSRRFPHLSVEQYFDQFKEQASQNNCDTLLLSGESFFGAPQIWRIPDGQTLLEAHTEKLQALRPYLKDIDVHVVVYLKPQYDWFESAVTQVARYQGLLDHQVPEKDEDLLQSLLPHMNYTALLDLWQEIIQPSQLSVVPFYRDFLLENEIIADFFHRIDVPFSYFDNSTPITEEHHSLDRRYIWLKKELNTIPKTKTHERVIIAVLNTLNSQLPSIQKYRIPQTLKKQIMSDCESSNKKLTSKYGHDDQTFRIFSRDNPIASSDDTPLSEQECMEAITAFDNYYFSYITIWLRIRMGGAAFLRKNCPFVHAVIKKLIMVRKQRA